MASKCKYADKCWRYLYTQAALAGIETNELTRGGLQALGFCSAEIATPIPRKDGKITYKGIYAEVLPLPNKPLTHCPGEGEHCPEYRKGERMYKGRERGKNKRPYRPTITPQLKNEIGAAQGWKCYYCERHNTKFAGKGQYDHIVPVALGGETVRDNLVYACSWCNGKKGIETWSKGQMKGKVPNGV